MSDLVRWQGRAARSLLVAVLLPSGIFVAGGALRLVCIAEVGRLPVGAWADAFSVGALVGATLATSAPIVGVVPGVMALGHVRPGSPELLGGFLVIVAFLASVAFFMFWSCR